MQRNHGLQSSYTSHQWSTVITHDQVHSSHGSQPQGYTLLPHNGRIQQNIGDIYIQQQGQTSATSWGQKHQNEQGQRDQFGGVQCNVGLGGPRTLFSIQTSFSLYVVIFSRLF